MRTHLCERMRLTEKRIATDRKPKPKRAFPLVYVVLGLCFCVFAGSVWFSSYAKKVALQRKPVYERQMHRIQDEIHQLELEEATLTAVERIRRIADELGMVEPPEAARVLNAPFSHGMTTESP